jgi:acyl transferase domain-containing protein/acyl carrier protein
MSEPREMPAAPVAGGAPGIAIVGLAARFPGAADAGELWQNLAAGVESISFLSGEELAAAGVDPADLADPRYVPAKGVLADADRFDAAFFGLTPREAEVMDPQHRVFLECAWEALEDAGCDPARVAERGGRIGVWAGSGTSSYLIANLLPDRARLASLGGLQVLLLNDRDFLATRISYTLDLKGPSVAVQTACSTSLVAVHLACQSLLGGECDVALAGGVSISVPLASGYLYQEGSVASPDGHCRAFDAAAAGSVEGNGCGVVALKRLEDALADGDRIYAVIRGSAVNNDGAGKVGFTAPSVAGQADVITEALMIAGVPPETIGYVEAHGSGTPMGDPIEIAALTEAFRAAHGADRADHREDLRPGACAVGSIKTAIGHCNTAAGVAGLIKAVLALAHRTILPSLHFATPNPAIDFAASPFRVPTAAAPWKSTGTPRRAGVSSFGLGGTNVHAILEEAPEVAPSDPPARPWQLLVLSARTAPALDDAAARLADHLEAHPETELADVAWTLATGRKAFAHRRIVVARDREGALAALAGSKIAGRSDGTGARPVVFLFPGLGDQYVDMARELYEAEPVFRREVDRCAEALAPRLGADLRQVLFSDAPRSAPTAAAPDPFAHLRRGAGEARAEDPAEALLRSTRFAQPACFVVEYALGQLLLSWGIVPQALLGYSLGEYVAACLAGSLDLDQALTLVAERARAIEELPAGEMLAIPMAAAEVAPLLTSELSLAATNGPHFSVAGGPAAAVAELAGRLAERGVTSVRLRTTHAFHSAMMEPAVAPLAELARRVAPAMRPPRIPWISNVTGTWIAERDLADPGYWARHMRSTVRFAEGLSELLSEPDRVFLEVGPGSTLGTLVQQHPAAAPRTEVSPRVAVPTLRRAEEGGADVEHLLTAVGRLWIAGVAIDWAGLHGGERRRKVALPTYPFERQRYWIDPPIAGPATTPAVTSGTDVAADLADWFWVPAWKRLPLAAAPPPLLTPSANGNGAGERWLLLLDGLGLGERIADRLREEGHAVATVEAGAGIAEITDRLREGGGLPAKILHLGGLTAAEPSIEPEFAAAQQAGLGSLIRLAQAISGAGGGSIGGEIGNDLTGPIRLGLVANGLAEVVDGDPVHPGKATVLGALKVVRQELTRLSIGAIDVALPGDERAVDAWIEPILREMAEMRSPAEPVVALRGRHRYVRGFEPVRLPEPADLAPQPVHGLFREAVYLIAGVADGPGMALAEHLVERVGARVALLLPEGAPARWEGHERVLILRGDVASALAAIRARFGPLSGAFWTGGAFAGGLLQLKDPEALAAALAPVAGGAAALLAALDETEPGVFAVLSSTTTAVTGSLGQLEAAAAGSYLEALAERRNAQNGGRTLAVHWDPYQWGGWLVALAGGGMAPADEVAANLAANSIASERSAAALALLLGNPLPGASGVIVSARPFPALLAETDSVTADTLFAPPPPSIVPAGERAGRPELKTPYEAPRDELEGELAAIWQELFGIRTIGRDDSFIELGGHSLLAIQIVTQVKGRLAADLPVTALFEAPTVAQLAKAVRRARGEADPEEIEALLALVEGLSPEEATERLAELGV